MRRRIVSPSLRAASRNAVLAMSVMALASTQACRDHASEAGRRDPGAGGDTATSLDGLATGTSTSEARFVRNIGGFQGPESVKYDPQLDVFFVSNMAGYGSATDNNGYIVRVSAANPDSAVIIAQGGKNGVTLDSPKGMAIHGDTVWVADIHALRAFHRMSGQSLGTIEFAGLGAVQLNDVAIGPDGSIHVTDTGIIMGKDGVQHIGPDRIFVVGPNRVITEMARGPQLHQPNGITWDPHRKRWIVVSFDPFYGEVAAMPDSPTGDGKREVLRTGNGKGELDGVEVLDDGSILFTSWMDSTIHLLKDGKDRPIIRRVQEAADIGVDTKRNRLAIPLSSLDRVQLWALGPIGKVH